MEDNVSKHASTLLLDIHQQDFIGKDIAREKKKLDENLGEKRISPAEYAVSLTKAIESAGLKFQKVLEDESKMLGRLAEKRRREQK